MPPRPSALVSGAVALAVAPAGKTAPSRTDTLTRQLDGILIDDVALRWGRNR